MPLRRACSSSSSGRITFSRSRQSLRTHTAPPSSSRTLFGLIGEFAQFSRIGTTEPRLDAAAAAGAQEKLLGDGVGVGLLLVQVLLDVGDQPVDLAPVIDIDEELHEGSVLLFRACRRAGSAARRRR